MPKNGMLGVKVFCLDIKRNIINGWVFEKTAGMTMKEIRGQLGGYVINPAGFMDQSQSGKGANARREGFCRRGNRSFTIF